MREGSPPPPPSRSLTAAGCWPRPPASASSSPPAGKSEPPPHNQHAVRAPHAVRLILALQIPAAAAPFVSCQEQLPSPSRPTERLEFSRSRAHASLGRPRPRGPRLTAGVLEARGRAVPQRGTPTRAGLVLLRLLRVGGAGRRRGPGALVLVVRGGGRRGARGGRCAVEGVPAAVRARLAEHVVRDVQALVARAGRLEQRRRPPPRAPAALGHSPGRRPRARPPQRLPAARAGPRARAAARRPPPAQPAAQRPPPRARPARRLGRLGPNARGSALGARAPQAAGRGGTQGARAGGRGCSRAQAPPLLPPLRPPLRLLGACRVPARPPAAPRAPRPTFPGASRQRRTSPPRTSGPPANDEPGRGGAGARHAPPPSPGRGEERGGGGGGELSRRGRAAGGFLACRDVRPGTATRRPCDAPQGEGKNRVGVGRGGDSAGSSCRPSRLTESEPRAHDPLPQLAPGTRELSAPVVLNQALRKLQVGRGPEGHNSCGCCCCFPWSTAGCAASSYKHKGRLASSLIRIRRRRCISGVRC